MKPSTGKELTAFSFTSANNPGLSADVAGTISGTTITATVPFGSSVTALRATYNTTGTAVFVGSTVEVSGVTENDFTAPLTYHVVAADGSSKDYTVTVKVAASSAKDLTAFAFLLANNSALTTDATATIVGTSISATVPYGTNVTALVATFATTGTGVTIGGTVQLSGTTANDFTAPVIYRVTAADGSTKDYTVTVTIALNTAKDLTAFSFLSANNGSTLNADVTATIVGTTISATVPYGTNVTALVATFSTTGAGVTIGGTAQVSGTTANDFTLPVVYRVTAANGTTKDYTVTVTIALNTAKDLTAFSFLSANNGGVLTANVTATIVGTTISATVPYGTDVTALVATFSTTGAGVTIGGTAQVSGTTANDFTSPVVYRVTAADSTTKDYTVTVTIALNPAKDITAFSFLSVNNGSTLSADVPATIVGTSITATVPYGTDVTALVATFSTTGAGVTIGGTAQVSDVTANDFTAPVIYRVTAADSTTKDYTVTVTIALNPAKDITLFSFLSVNNGSTLSADVSATIVGTSITATVPYGTAVTALVATFSTTGAGVTIGGTVQVSNVTANDFTAPVIYRVTAADSTTKDYTVTVTVALNPAKEITAFSFLSANNGSTLTADVPATIVGTSITATVPYGTDVTALVATFSTTGAGVTIGGTAQVSGTTANDFTAPVTYRVTAADSSTKDYTVTVTVALNPAKDITLFSFLSVNNGSTLSADVPATIVGTAISATVPYGTNVTALVATFTTTGAAVTVGGTAQVSNVTANDFTSPVTYRVTAADSSTQDYTVTVTVALNPAKDITAFSFLSVNNGATLSTNVTATITGTAIAATVPFGTNVTALVATFSTTGAGVTVAGTTQVSNVTANNFTSAVTYRVTAADSSTQDYTVTVTIQVGAGCGRFTGGQSGGWVTRATYPGSPSPGFSDVGPVTTGDFYSVANTNTRSYNPGTDTWSALAPPPISVQDWNSFAWVSSQYLYTIAVSGVYRYDTVANTWTTLLTGLPVATWATTTHDDSGNLWAHSSTANTLIRYNIAANTYSTIAYAGNGQISEPHLVWDSCAEKLYITPVFYQGAVFSYDPATTTTVTLATHPANYVNDVFCGDRSGHLYSAGSGGGTTFWKYDIATNAWSSLPATPFDHGNSGACTVTLDNWLYFTNQAGGQLARIELL